MTHPRFPASARASTVWRSIGGDFIDERNDGAFGGRVIPGWQRIGTSKGSRSDRQAAKKRNRLEMHRDMRSIRSKGGRRRDGIGRTARRELDVLFGKSIRIGR